MQKSTLKTASDSELVSKACSLSARAGDPCTAGRKRRYKGFSRARLEDEVLTQAARYDLVSRSAAHATIGKANKAWSIIAIGLILGGGAVALVAK